jgi:hypothetical protein
VRASIEHRLRIIECAVPIAETRAVPIAERGIERLAAIASW